MPIENNPRYEDDELTGLTEEKVLDDFVENFSKMPFPDLTRQENLMKLHECLPQSSKSTQHDNQEKAIIENVLEMQCDEIIETDPPSILFKIFFPFDDTAIKFYFYRVDRSTKLDAPKMTAPLVG